MVQQQKTIILTTHYIEEANEAAYVSLYWQYVGILILFFCTI